MLELNNICKTFTRSNVDKKELFKNFSLKINKGDFISVVGSNGSGKTTMLNIISGDVYADSGEIFLDGVNISKFKNYKRARDIARVYQNPDMGTCPSMTIFENLSVADNKNKSFNLTKGLNKKRKDFYRSQLELLGMGLENRMNALAGTLSGGQRQALALIMATMVTPKILLLDEHTAALDPKSGDIIMNLTQKIVEERKLTTLMVTHNLRYAVEYGNRAIMMHEGNFVFDVCGKEKEEKSIEDYLEMFNKISIECGN